MAIHLVIRLILPLLLVVELAEATPAMAKPNCTDRCGNLDIQIPFPFGIGRDCYLDEWFEVVCNDNSTSPKLILKNLDMEILSIFIENSTFQAKSPIIHSGNCSSQDRFGTTNAVVSIEGSPFIYSDSHNVFVAVGCNNVASMMSIQPAFVGCQSDCEVNNDTATTNSSTNKGLSCSGIDCCQTTIPSDLGVFNATFKSIDEDRDQGVGSCKFALLVDQNWWYGYKITNACDPFRVPYRADVPVVLDWYIWGSYANDLPYYRSPWVRIWWSNYNGRSGVSSFHLRCRIGYVGNAYLGCCEDVNECEDPKLNHCPNQCENTKGSYRCGKHMLSTILGISISFGVPTLVMILWWLYNVIKKRNEVKLKKKLFKRNGGLLLQQQVSSTDGNVEAAKIFSSTELEKATDHFNESRIIGQGGQGTVYKGMLDDGRIVAIKKSKGVDEGVNLEQFINEVVILSQINHRNVVNLLGCCLETEVPLLVYEYIPNGTLFQYLHDQTEEFLLTWNVRLRIAREVAGALSYLHSAASIPIYHRDIKSTNILLDEKYRAKVADFGTSRSVAIDQTHLTTFVHGTFGYLDPNYFHTSQFTEKSDVYSFGVVLAELLTGEKPISFTRSQEARGLAIYFVLTVEENHLFDILDPRIEKEGNKEEIMAVAELAKNCLNWNSKRRPTMREVAMKLEIVHGVHENCEELKYNVSEEIELWGVASMPTMSLESGATSLSDVRPLLFPETV